MQELLYVDVDAPEFVFVPADLTIGCDDGDIPLESATAEDACGEAVGADIVGGPCPEPYQIEP